MGARMNDELRALIAQANATHGHRAPRLTADGDEREYDPDRANRGKGLEDALDAMHEVYRARGLADVVQQFAKVVVSGRKSKRPGEAVHVVKTPRVADFMGSLASGRSVALEAKRFTWDEDDGGLPRFPFKACTDGQIAFMRRWPGVGVLVIEGRIRGRLSAWAVPFAHYLAALDASIRRSSGGGRRRAAPGAASWSCPELDVLGVRLDGVDWLRAVTPSSISDVPPLPWVRPGALSARG